MFWVRSKSFVKIDTEGSEILVLKGMSKTLNSKNLIIGIEQLKEEFFIKENTYKSKCLELLKKKGFNFFYEIEIKEWRFEHSYFSKFFKLLEIIFFIKPSTDVKLKRINIFKKKKLSTNYLFKKRYQKYLTIFRIRKGLINKKFSIYSIPLNLNTI